MPTLSYIQIQEHPNAVAISDDDLCASCRKCLFCPGALSLCQISAQGADFPALRDEDGYSYACEHFELLEDHEIEEGSNLVDPVMMLRHTPIPAGFYTQLHAQAMEHLMAALPSSYDPKLLNTGRLFFYQLHTGEEFSIPLLDSDELVTISAEQPSEDAPVVRLKTISVLSVAMALLSLSQQAADPASVLLDQLRTLLLSAAEFRDEAALISTTFEDLAPEFQDEPDDITPEDEQP